MSHPAPIGSLTLVKELKIRELLPDGCLGGRFEASGVCYRDSLFYVVFDNAPHIARLHSSLAIDHPANVLLCRRGVETGFEDITYHQSECRFLVIIESLEVKRGVRKPKIVEYDDDLRYLGGNWVDFPLKRKNKGLEGLAYVRRNGQDYLLGLCEGNRCKGGRKGRVPGGGRIQLFQKGADQWNHRGTIELPRAVQFRDYASLDVAGDRVAVVSQMDSALWVGAFREDSWEFVDDGATYPFPRDEAGKRVYCNVEGVSWINRRRIAVVSDKRKRGEQRRRCRGKDQSIHIFDLPGVG